MGLFSGMFRGMAQSANSYPEAIRYRLGLQMQQAAAQRAELESRRNRLIEMFKVAASSGDPEAIVTSGAAMQQSGLFPEMSSLFGPGAAIPQAPSVATPQAPSVESVPPQLNAAGEIVGDVGATPGGTLGKKPYPPFTAKQPSEALWDLPIPEIPERPDTKGKGFLAGLAGGASYKDSLKEYGEVLKLRTNLLSENRLLKSQLSEQQRLQEEQLSNGIIWKRDKDGKVVIVGRFDTPGLDASQMIRLNVILDRALNSMPDKTPKQAYDRAMLEISAADLPFSPEHVTALKTALDGTAFGVNDYINVAAKDKVGNLGIVQDLSSSALRHFNALRPEQWEQFGVLQGRLLPLLEKYVNPANPAKANADAYAELSQDPGIVDQNLRDMLMNMSQAYEVFARMQTGAQISETERGDFSNLMGNTTMKPNAIVSRLMNMIRFGDTARKGVYGNALRLKYSAQGGDVSKGMAGEANPEAQAQWFEDLNYDGSNWLPYIPDQILSEMVLVPNAETLYPREVAEWRRRHAQ